MCSRCFPPGCPDIGELLSKPWFSFACCTQRCTTVTCSKSRTNETDFSADEERCHKAEKLINSSETDGKPALYPHFFLSISSYIKVNQRHYVVKSCRKKSCSLFRGFQIHLKFNYIKYGLFTLRRN